jgi:hypothetical protein
MFSLSLCHKVITLSGIHCNRQIIDKFIILLRGDSEQKGGLPTHFFKEKKFIAINFFKANPNSVLFYSNTPSFLNVEK